MTKDRVSPAGRSDGVDVPGMTARRTAMLALDEFLVRSQPLDETLERLFAGPEARDLAPRDRGLARAIATASVRHLGSIGAALQSRLARGLPRHSGRLETILVASVAQILYLDVPDHAAVDLALRLVHADPDGRRFAALANGILRTIARERDAVLASADPLGADTPEWLARRWIKTYGEATARRIAEAHMHEASVDLSVKSDPEGWAKRLGAALLPTGSLRLVERSPIVTLPGYDEGAWWVQDAAAAVPARLLGVVAGERVADFCAAPGGKTAQLASAGAHVTAIDRSAKRLERLEENMKRLGLLVETIAADAASLKAEPFDAILIDAPCSATGTIRRHPDVAWIKQEGDLARLAALQTRLIDAAARLLRPGGRLVYCTCSLEPEEGDAQIAAALQRHPELIRSPLGEADRMALGSDLAAVVNERGELRTLPFIMPNDDPRLAGVDGFFAARLVRS